MGNMEWECCSFSGLDKSGNLLNKHIMKHMGGLSTLNSIFIISTQLFKAIMITQGFF